MRVGAVREPPQARDRHRVGRLPAELPDVRGAGVDLVDHEVGARAPFAGLHARDRRTLLIADRGRVVIGRAGNLLELPPEERTVELPHLLVVVGRDLDVHELTGHVPPYRCHLHHATAACSPGSAILTSSLPTLEPSNIRL